MNVNNENYIQIGKLADMCGITTRTIRYYEEIGLMSPPKRLEGGIRVYSQEDTTRLKFILKLKELGISLKEMEELAEIYKMKKKPLEIMPRLMEILDIHIRKIDEKISNLSSLRGDIVDYRTRITDLMKEGTIPGMSAHENND